MSIVAAQGLFITAQSEVVVVSHSLPVQFFDELSSRLMAVDINPLLQPSLDPLKCLARGAFHHSQLTSPVFCQVYLKDKEGEPSPNTRMKQKWSVTNESTVDYHTGPYFVKIDWCLKAPPNRTITTS